MVLAGSHGISCALCYSFQNVKKKRINKRNPPCMRNPPQHMLEETLKVETESLIHYHKTASLVNEIFTLI
jgi:hypothetical protein